MRVSRSYVPCRHGARQDMPALISMCYSTKAEALPQLSLCLLSSYASMSSVSSRATKKVPKVVLYPEYRCFKVTASSRTTVREQTTHILITRG